jgi:hypothetical protein
VLAGWASVFWCGVCNTDVITLPFCMLLCVSQILWLPLHIWAFVFWIRLQCLACVFDTFALLGVGFIASGWSFLQLQTFLPTPCPSHSSLQLFAVVQIAPLHPG